MKTNIYYPSMKFDLKNFDHKILIGILENAQRRINDGYEIYLCTAVRHLSSDDMFDLMVALPDCSYNVLRAHAGHIMNVIEAALLVPGPLGLRDHTTLPISEKGVAGWLMHRNMPESAVVFPQATNPVYVEDNAGEDAFTVFWTEMYNKHRIRVAVYRNNWMTRMIEELQSREDSKK